MSAHSFIDIVMNEKTVDRLAIFVDTGMECSSAS